jgi:hypothetical protein
VKIKGNLGVIYLAAGLCLGTAIAGALRVIIWLKPLDPVHWVAFFVGIVLFWMAMNREGDKNG